MLPSTNGALRPLLDLTFSPEALLAILRALDGQTLVTIQIGEDPSRKLSSSTHPHRLWYDPKRDIMHLVVEDEKIGILTLQGIEPYQMPVSIHRSFPAAPAPRKTKI